MKREYGSLWACAHIAAPLVSATITSPPPPGLVPPLVIIHRVALSICRIAGATTGRAGRRRCRIIINPAGTCTPAAAQLAGLIGALLLLRVLTARDVVWMVDLAGRLRRVRAEPAVARWVRWGLHAAVVVVVGLVLLDGLCDLGRGGEGGACDNSCFDEAHGEGYGMLVGVVRGDTFGDEAGGVCCGSWAGASSRFVQMTARSNGGSVGGDGGPKSRCEGTCLGGRHWL